MTDSLLEFLRTAKRANIGIGTSSDEVTASLGEPDAIGYQRKKDRANAIWYFGDEDTNNLQLRLKAGSVIGLGLYFRSVTNRGVESIGEAGSKMVQTDRDSAVQDMMILHGSPPKRSLGVRRTIYVELRPAAGITESNAQSEQWKELRKRWMGLVVRRAEASDYPQSWGDDLCAHLGSDKEVIASILKLWEPPIPAVYCHMSRRNCELPGSG